MTTSITSHHYFKDHELEDLNDIVTNDSRPMIVIATEMGISRQALSTIIHGYQQTCTQATWKALKAYAEGAH